MPNALAGRAANGTMAHAYILAAQAPDALKEAADAVAAAMVCAAEGGSKVGQTWVEGGSKVGLEGVKGGSVGAQRVPCGQCKHCQKVAKGIHPDVIVISPEPGKELLVDQIRELRQDAYIRPNEAKRKVYILENAHKMNPSAQNAFLKVLEEGPLYAAFLLLTPSPGALLPTIRSRCETVLVSAQGAEADPELARKAGELAGLLLGEDKWRLISWCAEREKDKREEAAALLEETRRAILRYRSETTTPKAARLALTLQELIAQLNGNANVGCVLGRLWAEAGEKEGATI